MPRGDRTGPAGMGPMSGRGAGYCAGYARLGFANGLPGRGAGMNRGAGAAPESGGAWMPGGGGAGRGWRNWFRQFGLCGGRRGRWPFGTAAAAPAMFNRSREDEIQALRNDLQGYERAAAQIRSRLEEMEKSA